MFERVKSLVSDWAELHFSEMHEDENEASEEANITDSMKASKARLIRQNSILQTLYSVSSRQKGRFLCFRSNFFCKGMHSGPTGHLGENQVQKAHASAGLIRLTTVHSLLTCFLVLKTY